MTSALVQTATTTACTLKPIPIDVVSVQSQVIYGHVGNSVALPALRAHGLNVAAVPTVLLSNTPHYPTLHGGALPVEWFEGYLQDLSARGALQHLRTILIGYLGSEAQVIALARWIKQIQVKRPAVQVIVDPVFGDQDVGAYVASDVVQAMCTHILPLAHGLTPNGFELGHLSRQPVDSLEQVIRAAQCLLSERLRWLVITSAAPSTCLDSDMQLTIVTHSGSETIRHRRIPASPKGTGDLFTAELTARLLANTQLYEAVLGASNQVLAAVDLTYRTHCTELLLPKQRNAFHSD